MFESLAAPAHPLFLILNRPKTFHSLKNRTATSFWRRVSKKGSAVIASAGSRACVIAWNAASISSSLLARKGWIWTPTVFAAASTSRSAGSAAGNFGLSRTPIIDAPGMRSRNTLNRSGEGRVGRELQPTRRERYWRHVAYKFPGTKANRGNQHLAPQCGSIHRQTGRTGAEFRRAGRAHCSVDGGDSELSMIGASCIGLPAAITFPASVLLFRGTG